MKYLLRRGAWILVIIFSTLTLSLSAFHTAAADGIKENIEARTNQIMEPEGDSTPPVIDVWYGTHQFFGSPGMAQQWVNILGNASDPESGIASLSYTLNGGTPSPLLIGPDERRLLSEGDFNVEIDRNALNPGQNTLVITSTNGDGLQSSQTVTVEYIPDQAWPLPYSIDWSQVGNLQDAVQVVDGRWTLTGSGIRTSDVGYDRVIAIGDMSWEDYEVTFPVTIHALDGSGYNPISVGPGLGVNLRWQGHTDNPEVCSQPHCGWIPFGASNWIEWYQSGLETLSIDASPPNGTAETSSLSFSTGNTYWFKARVETASAGSLYRLKVWEDGQTEPANWTLQRQTQPGNLASGSLLLVAHHVDATFGNLSVVPLSGYAVSTTVVGSGTVTKNPSKSSHGYNETVVLTASPDPGWTFAGWGGDLTGTANPANLTVTGDRAVTATFTQNEYTLTVNASGSGSVTRNPEKATYKYGEQVTLMAAADPGWSFSGWSGGASGLANPVTIPITGNTTVNAAFTQNEPTQNEYTLTVNPSGSGSVTRNPQKSTYKYGEQVTLTAAADPGWSFSSWSGGASGSTNPVTIPITGNTTVNAAFTQNEYALTANKVGEGSVSVNPPGPYNYGDTVVLTATPDPNWTFSGWSGSVTGNENPVTATITGNAAITATLVVRPAQPGADSTPPVIDVWYGDTQVFGYPGTTQQWVNILGNASDPESPVASLSYSLNGGPPSPLSIGPDQRRLLSKGDFNVEIDKDDLNWGQNTLVITSTNGDGLQSAQTVTVEYIPGQAWPLPYSIDWSDVTNLQDAVQVVDGLWDWDANGIHTLDVGYDRVIAIGDMSWEDYEVTFPVTIHAIDGSAYNPISVGPGLGVNLRWQGHTDNPEVCPQPHCGWIPFGASNWIEWHQSGLETLSIDASPPNGTAETSSLSFSTGNTYWFRARVETASAGSLYRLKVWEDGQTEPASWTLQRQTQSGNLASGSLLLVAHHVDATFGNLSVVPLSGYGVSTTVVGSGTVTKNPSKSTYSYNDFVQLTATPAPGWTFSGWSGDLTGTANPANLTVTGNRAITATFIQNEYTLTVNPTGSGSVTRNPEKATYKYGEQVTLTAAANPGWSFSSWSGGASGSTNPVTIPITGNTTVNAAFTQNEYTLTVSTSGSGSVVKNPQKSTYRYGDQVTLTATAAQNWTFSGWSGSATGNESPKTITITGNTAITATFAPSAFTLTVNTIGLGKVLVEPLKSGYSFGDLVTLTAIPDPGGKFLSWGGDVSGTDIKKTIAIGGPTTVTGIFTNRVYNFIPLVTREVND